MGGRGSPGGEAEEILPVLPETRYATLLEPSSLGRVGFYFLRDWVSNPAPPTLLPPTTTTTTTGADRCPPVR